MSKLQFRTLLYFSCNILLILQLNSCSSTITDALLVHRFQPQETGLYAAPENDAAWYRTMKQQYITHEYLTSSDGLNLHAINLRNPKPTNKVIISVHGWSKGAYTQLFKYGRFFCDQVGTNVVLPDLRNNGASEGSVSGWGTLDVDDIHLWIDRTISIYGKDCQIILHGLSVGGTAVLFAAAEALPPNVKCIISDAAVYSFNKLIMHHLNQLRNNESKNKELLAEMQDYFIKKPGGFPFEQITLEGSIEKITLPTLFIYSQTDFVVPQKMHEEMIAHAAMMKEVWKLKKCPHDQIVIRYPNEYCDTVSAFINTWAP